jgi:hypothetical protein
VPVGADLVSDVHPATSASATAMAAHPDAQDPRLRPLAERQLNLRAPCQGGLQPCPRLTKSPDVHSPGFDRRPPGVSSEAPNKTAPDLGHVTGLGFPRDRALTLQREEVTTRHQPRAGFVPLALAGWSAAQ